MQQIDATHSFHIFQLASIALWIEDWSEIGHLFRE